MEYIKQLVDMAMTIASEQENDAFMQNFLLYQYELINNIERKITIGQKTDYIVSAIIAMDTANLMDSAGLNLMYGIYKNPSEKDVVEKLIQGKAEKSEYTKKVLEMTKLIEPITGQELRVKKISEEEHIQDQAQLSLIINLYYEQQEQLLAGAREQKDISSLSYLSAKQQQERNFKILTDPEQLALILPQLVNLFLTTMYYREYIRPWLLRAVESVESKTPIVIMDRLTPILEISIPTQDQVLSTDYNAMPKILSLPKDYKKLAPRFSDEELWKFISFLFKQNNKSGEPFLSKEDTRELFKYGLVIPPERLEQPFKLNLGVDKSNDKTTIYSIFYEFYRISQETGTKKDAIAAFLFRHFDNFDTENSIYDALRKGDLGFEIEPYKPIPKKLQEWKKE
jgi:hypothetical protein